MRSARRILLTTDFTDSAAIAYPHAVALAADAGAELILVNVVTVFHDEDDVVRNSPVFPEYAEHIEGAAQERLNAVTLPEVPGLQVRRVLVRHAEPAGGIVTLARTEDVDLIVIASHGRRPLGQLLLGSVAMNVVSDAPCPVLTIKPKDQGMWDPETGSLRIKRLLVPTDLSETSHRAVELATEVARTYGAAITFLHVVHADIPPVYFAGGIGSVFELDSEMPRRVEAELRRFVSSVDTTDLSMSFMVEEGATSSRIAGIAKEEESDVIILTRRGHGDTPHLMGGVCRQLVHDAPCPMLIV